MNNPTAPVLRVKLLKNVMFTLPGVPLILPPLQTKRQSLHDHGIEAEALLNTFDLQFVHTIELPDISPRMPRRRKEWNDRYFAALEDAAFAECVQRRVLADNLRKHLKHHIDRGTIVVVEDGDPSGFLDDEPVSAVEVAAANPKATK